MKMLGSVIVLHVITELLRPGVPRRYVQQRIVRRDWKNALTYARTVAIGYPMVNIQLQLKCAQHRVALAEDRVVVAVVVVLVADLLVAVVQAALPAAAP